MFCGTEPVARRYAKVGTATYSRSAVCKKHQSYSFGQAIPCHSQKKAKAGPTVVSAELKAAGIAGAYLYAAMAEPESPPRATRY